MSAIAGFRDGGVNGPYTCTVSYGDGSGTFAGAVSGSVCSGPAHTYDDNGGFQVKVVVTDKAGVSGTANQLHQVINVAPTGEFAVIPKEIFAGESAEAGFSNVFDPSAADSVAGVSYSYDCNGDGIWEGTGHSLSRFSCRFINSGTFTVAGEIRDKDDGRTRYSAVVTVLSPQQAMQVLIDEVNALVAAGGLSRQRAVSLIKKLEIATASLDRGNSIAAVNEIEAFQHEVEAFTNARIITSAQSQLLLATARRLLDAVNVLN